MGKIHARRVYEDALPQDGTRVLVDRLWPRGVSREKAQLGEWLKPVAPSTGLRRWFGHSAERFEEFRTRYRAELELPERAESVQHLRELVAAGDLSLLTAARNVDCSHAAVLVELLTDAQNVEPREEGGDSACWIRHVCPNCGALEESEVATICSRCHAELERS
jgi:uncharacterized protein YeaO (DUF488 family)